MDELSQLLETRARSYVQCLSKALCPFAPNRSTEPTRSDGTKRAAKTEGRSVRADQRDTKLDLRDSTTGVTFDSYLLSESFSRAV